ncbi:hypothetical protein CRYUN_Cryun07bG0171700 [Craigia yunnanensis]
MHTDFSKILEFSTTLELSSFYHRWGTQLRHSLSLSIFHVSSLLPFLVSYINPRQYPNPQKHNTLKIQNKNSDKRKLKFLLLLEEMASLIALRRVSVSSLFSKLVNLSPVRTVSVATPSVSRSFNTNAQVTNFNDEDRSVDVERRSDRSFSRRRENSPGFFSDVFDPFSPTRSLSQVRNLMDHFMDHPFLSSPSLSSRKGWDVRDDNDALCLRIEMPGLSKEDVKVSVDQNTLIIRGEGSKESEDEESGRRYSSRLDLPPSMYKVDEIKAEMKNGVLEVVVPKVKEQERKDVYQVTVE